MQVLEKVIPDKKSRVRLFSLGMLMPGRTYSSSTYRYGFNGKEKDNEVKSDGNQYDYGERIYDPRISKWLSPDPISKANLSPYQFASGNPINFIDPDGADEIHFIVHRKVYQSGMGNAYGPSTMTIQIIPKDGPDRFFYKQVNDVMKLTYPKPTSWYQTNVGSPTASYSHTETTNTEFYPHPASPGAHWSENRTGVTSSGIYGGDNDFMSLMKLSTPELRNYLINHNDKEYGALSWFPAAYEATNFISNLVVAGAHLKLGELYLVLQQGKFPYLDLEV